MPQREKKVVSARNIGVGMRQQPDGTYVFLDDDASSDGTSPNEMLPLALGLGVDS